MKVIRLENEHDERLDIFYRLNEKQLKHFNEPEPGFFIGESELVINRALDEGYKPVSFLIKDKDVDLYKNIFDRCDENIIVYEVSEEIFNKLKGFILIKGILACFIRKNELKIEDILNKSNRIVVLEEVENPTNIGAIFRNAAGLFADGVLLTEDSCDPLYRRSIRVSMGNVFKMKWSYVKKENYIDILRQNGFKTVALALRDDAIDIDDERLNKEEKLAIILGSEGYGLSNKTINDSDYVVKIKMNPDVDSLNVASASGIALWRLCKKED